MPLTNLSFLIAEDQGFQRRMIVRVLHILGVRVIREATDGNEALKVIQDLKLPVDIVISDLDMPGMDGMEFIRRLGESKRRVSLIVSSSLESKLLASVATMTQAYGVTLLGVVEKPLTLEKLRPLLNLYNEPQLLQTPLEPISVFSLDEIATGLRNDEFEPFLQPKIELATGLIKGVEALARWRHPQKGIVAPHAFIKLLEKNDLMDDLTWVMLGKAAKFCRTWREAGMDATVSVNLSLRSLGDVNIAERVTELVRSRNLDPHHMILEVTESAATTEVGTALENLARLRMKGFGLSIDDYGTGYSSMQQLTRIAFTELKIDQSFVLNALKQSSARVILESSLDMARKLNMTSVAEGVETQADLNLLCQLNCDMAQGYFIARPMEYSKFQGWIEDWNKDTRFLALSAGYAANHKVG